MASLLTQLAKLDNLKLLGNAPCLSVIHQDHRWTLPLIFYAQEQELVPRPCRLVSFDAHLDNCDPMQSPDSRAFIERLAGSSMDTDALIELCQSHLRTLDDDWLKAAMALGLVSDAVVFGSRNGQGIDLFNYGNVEHRIIACPRPAHALDYQGDLCDTARADAPKLKHLWRVLGWKRSGERYAFCEDSSRLFVTIDLDYFACDWGDYLFPWPAKVYQREFQKHLPYSNRTGLEFFRDLIDRAGFLDIAREPKHCGGEEDAEQIFRDMNRILFDGALTVEDGAAAG